MIDGEKKLLIALVKMVSQSCVGRVIFSPPLHVKWRVKENPPYALETLVVSKRAVYISIYETP
jgi:hypothetical protein